MERRPIWRVIGLVGNGLVRLRFGAVIGVTPPAIGAALRSYLASVAPRGGFAKNSVEGQDLYRPRGFAVGMAAY